MQPGGPAKVRVLVVDDYADGRGLMTEYLTFSGFEVLEAENGSQAIEVARRERPDVILMDLQLPVVDGWEATRALKADPATKHIVVVAVTAHSREPERRLAREAGCDAIVIKPFDITALTKVLGQLTANGASALDIPTFDGLRGFR